MNRPPGLKTAVCLLGAVAALVLADRLLPPDLSRYEARSTVVTDAEGGVLRAFLSKDDAWRLAATPETVDADYLRLLLSYEDRRFRLHPGVDPLALSRAAAQWAVNGRIVSGGSTLTMQAARLLEPDAPRRGLWAKLRQMLRALQLEARLSKREILNIYLTLAPFGGNVEGVRAASLAYFGKEPGRITLAQSALLVALPQSPERQRPDRVPDEARAARDKVLSLLHARGIIPTRKFKEALAEPVPDYRRPFPFRAPRLARALKARHPGMETIRTHIDGALQLSLEDLIGRETRWLDDGAAIAAVILDNRTCRAIAYLGGSDFWGSAGHVDLARAPRSPGSTLKPFIYAIAFADLGLHPETIIDDEPMVFGSYSPRNFSGGFQGMVSMRRALQQSLNVPAVALLDRIGPARFASSLRQGGGRLVFSRPGVTPSLPIALGGTGLTLFELTELYAGLARGGLSCNAALTRNDRPSAAKRFLSETGAWYVSDILADAPAPEGWTWPGAPVEETGIAFKTGTSYGFRDAWALGYTAGHTVGVWVGRPDGSARPGHIGRGQAAPILLKLFGLLPKGQKPPRPPQALTVTARGKLPPAMQRFRLDRTRLPQGASGISPPRIAFPPNGSTLILPEREEERGFALRAAGGTPPLRWMVDGGLLPPAGPFGATVWTPEGRGYARLSVIDAEGRAAHALVRVTD